MKIIIIGFSLKLGSTNEISNHTFMWGDNNICKYFNINLIIHNYL
jgi:hypothetical protein